MKKVIAIAVLVILILAFFNGCSCENGVLSYSKEAGEDIFEVSPLVKKLGKGKENPVDYYISVYLAEEKVNVKVSEELVELEIEFCSQPLFDEWDHYCNVTRKLEEKAKRFKRDYYPDECRMITWNTATNMKESIAKLGYTQDVIITVVDNRPDAYCPRTSYDTRKNKTKIEWINVYFFDPNEN